MSQASTSNLPSLPSLPSEPLFVVRERQQRISGDWILHSLTRTSAAIILLMLAALVAVLFFAAIPSIRAFGFSFLVSSEWRPNELERPKLDANGKTILEDGETVMETVPPAFGALPVIYGTVVSSILALVFAVPLSLGASIFLVRIAPNWLKPPVSFLIEFLAAIPSIAYGIWGLFVLAPFLQGPIVLPHWLVWVSDVPVLRSLFNETFVKGPSSYEHVVFLNGVEPTLNHLFGSIPGLRWLAVSGQPVGRDMLAGGAILGIMILPIITAISRDVLRQVPRAQVEGTVALGATWWQSSWEMIKYGRSALFGAVMLGLARAAGETMAITMVIGNNNQIVPSPFAPAQTMSSLLANEFAEASTEIHRAALIEVALILLVMSLLFNIVARYLVVGSGSRSAAAH